jgi:hypothetical protein
MKRMIGYWFGLPNRRVRQRQCDPRIAAVFAAGWVR